MVIDWLATSHNSVFMKTVGSYEAKTHLAQLLEEVAAGEIVTITKHGLPLASLVPVGENVKRDVGEVIRDMRAFRRGKIRGDGGIYQTPEDGE